MDNLARWAASVTDQIMSRFVVSEIGIPTLMPVREQVFRLLAVEAQRLVATHPVPESSQPSGVVGVGARLSPELSDTPHGGQPEGRRPPEPMPSGALLLTPTLLAGAGLSLPVML